LLFSIIANHKLPSHCDETSSLISTQQPIPGSDISYSIRHVEESWHHLIKSDDNKKLKEIAVANFDFLLAAVSLIYYNFSTRISFTLFFYYMRS